MGHTCAPPLSPPNPHCTPPRFLGIDASNPAAPTRLTALESTPALHNVIVCTLCSCYPQSILGLSPQWYRARSYRARWVSWRGATGQGGVM